MTALIHSTARRVAAEANWGRWVGACGWCPSAMALTPGTSAFRCRECGEATEVVWPSDAMVCGVERLLMMRPNVTTRNWRPGETLRDLMFENGAHGIFDRCLDDGPARILLTVQDDRITVDALPDAGDELRAVA